MRKGSPSKTEICERAGANTRFSLAGLREYARETGNP